MIPKSATSYQQCLINTLLFKKISIMKRKKYPDDKITFRFRGASVFATGTWGRVIAYSFAGLLIMIGIAAIRSSSNN